MAKSKATLKIDGMSCEHCVKTVHFVHRRLRLTVRFAHRRLRLTVTKALEELDGVKKAKVKLKRGLANVTYDSDKISVDGLVAAVVEAGYEAKA